MGVEAKTTITAHKHSSTHRLEIVGSVECGCFYCLKVFAPAQIEAWCDDGDTALCPHCGVDAVIGGNSGFPITDVAFLADMKSHWFR